MLYGGTYNGQHAALASASACLTKLKDGSVQKHLQALTDRLSEVFNEHSKVRNISARLEQCGGQFQVYFTDHDITDYRTAREADRERFQVFHRVVLNEGIWMKGSYLFHHGVTYAHNNEDLKEIITAFDKGLDAVKEVER